MPAMTMASVELGRAAARKRALSRRRPWRLAWVVLGVLLAGVAAIYLGYAQLREALAPQEEVSPPLVEPGARVNVLALGLDFQLDAHGRPLTDWRRSHGRADTVMLVSFDLKRKQAAILSLPRDSRVRIPGRGWDKLNAAHAYGGPSLAIATVQELTGVPVHYYLRTSFEGVARLVDLLGGVEFTVPQDMDYEDPQQGLYIHLRAGKQLLTGEKAVQLLRFRQYPEGDIERIKVQQAFLKAMADKALSVTTLAKLPFLVDDALACLDTNLPANKVLSLARLALGLETSELRTGTAPGVAKDLGGVSYWILDEQGLARSVRQVLYGVEEPVRVEVLNGTSRPGLAARVAEVLGKQGFSVVRIDNAPSPQRRTVIQSYGTDRRAQDALAAALSGMVGKPVLREFNVQNGAPDGYLTVLLGEDVVVKE